MKRIHIKKGQIIQHAGDLNTKIYEVESGLLRSYALDEKGKEHTFLFAPEGWLITDSVLPDEPSDLYIDALEDTVVRQRDKIIAVPEAGLDIHKIFNRMRALQKRVLMLLSASALERYEHFETTYPDIVQRVPQKLIASYLGITPEALSAVKKQRAQSTS